MSRVKRYKPKKHVVRQTQPEKWLTKKKLWTFIIAGLMVASVFGIMLGSYSDSPEQQKYGKYMFKRTSEGWTIKVDGKPAIFQYHPSDVERMPADEAAIERIRDSKVVYMTFNPSSKEVQTAELMRFELTNSLTEIFSIYTMQGATRMNETYNLPFVTCANATAMIPVIHISYSETPGVSLEGDCVLVKADQDTALALKDRILYGMMGILEEPDPEETVPQEPVPEEPAPEQTVPEDEGSSLSEEESVEVEEE